MIEEDHCVYVKRSEGSFIILSLYVDDILLAGNDKEFIKTIEEWLSSTFEMKDMGGKLCAWCQDLQRLFKKAPWFVPRDLHKEST